MIDSIDNNKRLSWVGIGIFIYDMTVVCYTMLCWIQQQYVPGQVVYCHASDSCVLM
jgi:hypothetical protein